MEDDRWMWMRDWAVIGGVTSAVAPLMASMLPLQGLPLYAACCAVLGAVTGAGVGALLRTVLGRAPRRTWVALCLTVVPLILGAWGGFVAGTVAALFYGDIVVLAIPCGSVAAVLQTAWLAPLYAWWSGRPWPRLPMVVSGALMAAPVTGVFAVGVGLLALQVINWF